MRGPTRAASWYFFYVPTYDLICKTCGHEFEMTSSIADREEKAICPECGSHHAQTVIKTFSVGTLHKGAADQLPQRSGALLGAAKP